MRHITFKAAMSEPLLGPEQERDAIRRWQADGDRDALEILIRSHARQAWSQATRWTDNPIHLEDLVAEGIIGLMRAADNFDLEQEVRFATYAGWWVMNGISSALARTKSVIDVPARAIVAMRSGAMSDEDSAIVKMAVQGIVALDAPVGDGSVSAMDILVSTELTPEEQATAESLHAIQRRLLDEALAGLNSEEAEVIRRRRLQPVPDSLEEAADAMCITRDRLRQVEKRAMLRLRRVLLEAGFSRAMLN